MIQRLSLIATLCALAAPASAQISFTGPVNYPAGVTPDATAAGDFNNDGDIDLATTSDNPDKLTIFANNGSGVFSVTGTVATGGGTSPHTPVAGDLDGDGDVDLAVSLKNVNQVRILVNNGAGTFTLGPVFNVGAEPRTMAIANIDGDGDLDLAVSNRSGNTVSVLTNLGGLNFSVQSYAGGTEPRSIAFGDLTGDGLPELAIAAHDDDAVRILGNGGGTFSLLTQINLSNSPEAVVIARLNADGSNDVATTIDNNNVNFVVVALNQGGGTFGGTNSFPTSGVDSGFLAAADMDLDGDVDLATSNTDTNNVSVLANNGNGGFGGAQLLAAGSQPSHVIAADLDGNGSPELVVTNEASGNISVYSNQASGGGCSTTTYCQAKMTSIGTFPSIGSTGTPSVTAQNFVVTLANARPNVNGLLFFSRTGAASTPFQGGTLCIAPPIDRLPAQQFTAQGTAAYPIAVTAGMVGTTRWYQFWFRDGQASFGTGLSNGLAVTFCQ